VSLLGPAVSSSIENKATVWLDRRHVRVLCFDRGTASWTLEISGNEHAAS
jgi:hypothetical protein